MRVTAQQSLVRPRKAIFGQMADHFKQRRAYVIVKILGGKFFLPDPCEPGPHLGRELMSGVRSNGMY
jgi:hypothetical protein